MRLSFSGSLEVGAPLAVVWQRLMDPHFVAAGAPGVERVEQVDDGRFTVFSAFGVGAIRLHVTLEVEVLHVIALQHLTMRAHGKAPGSGVDVMKAIDLVEAAADRTAMTWQSDFLMSGILAGLGVHFVEGTARKHTEQFWLDFAARCARAG